MAARVTGKDDPPLMQEQVFGPLGLVLAMAANGGSPDDAACHAVLARAESGWR